MNPASTPAIPAGIRSHRYRIVTAMKAPLPSPRAIIASGSRQQSEESAAPTHATRPAPIVAVFTVFALMPCANHRSRHMMDLLRLFGGERSVLVAEAVLPPAARDRIARLRGFGERHDVIAPGTAHAVRERRRPAGPVPLQTQRMAGAVRTLQKVA